MYALDYVLSKGAFWLIGPVNILVAAYCCLLVADLVSGHFSPKQFGHGWVRAWTDSQGSHKQDEVGLKVLEWVI